MKVKAKVTLNKKALKNLEAAQQRALKLTMEALRTDVIASQVTPKDKGILEDDQSFIDDSKLEKLVVSLVYDTPYARRLYWHPEYNFRTDKNPNAKGKWLEDYLSGDKKDFIPNTFAKFLKQEAKGLIK